MSKRALSAEMRNAIVWLERQPGVTSVVQSHFHATRHKHPAGSVKVKSADAKHVHVLVYDKDGMKDLYAYAPPSPTRDAWVARIASGNPFADNGNGNGYEPAVASKLLKDTIVPVRGEAARHIPKPDPVEENAAQIFDVTPELAARWLEHNTRNRKLRQSVVNRYAADMKNGRWLVTGDSICFDTNGAIINGQHRLWAVLEANMTVQMQVTFGLNPKVVAVLDDHLKRTTADVGGINRPGSGISSMHTSVANMLLQTSIMATAVDRRRALEGITRQAQLDAIDRHWEAIEFAWRDCFRSSAMRSITVTSVLTPVARAFYTQDHDRLRAFGKVMMHGMTETKKDQSAILLRNHLLKAAASKVKIDRDVIYRKTERALAAFLEGTPIAMLYEAASELFPLPEDKKPRGR